jgi:Asp-tRNA(Asn)/Glu-tRNA(Gln) amidotransferase B subunit
MIKETRVLKVPLKPNSTFGERERTINFEIQKQIDALKNTGVNVLEHTIINKTDSYATINIVTLKRR